MQTSSTLKRKKRAIDLTYCEYNLSTLQDSKGGFLYEKETEVEKRAIEVVPFVDMDPGQTCEHCESIDLDMDFSKYYKVHVCKQCKKDRPDEYSLLTKTECRADYLLTDSELRDASKLPCWIKANPHKSTYSNMLLYLRKQKWGSAEKLDDEFHRREGLKAERKQTKYKKKLVELRKKTRTSLWDSAQASHKYGLASDEHEHVYGDATPSGGTEDMVQACTICGMKVEFEEL